MKRFLCVCLILIFASACREDNPKIIALDAKLELLLKDKGLRSHFRIDNEGISMYASQKDKSRKVAECRIYPEEFEAFARLFTVMDPDSLLALYLSKGENKLDDSLMQITTEPPAPAPFDSLKPLAGLKIAIDPGHIAGDIETAQLEGKFVRMRGSNATEFAEISFWEANHTLATALRLQEKLKKDGAEVLLTRYHSGKNQRGQTFEKWKKEQMESDLYIEEKAGRLTAEQVEFYRNKATETQVFRYLYNAIDLRARAKKINRFHPDRTIIIHYNVHGPNWDNMDEAGYISPTMANYSMAFTPGSFMKNELKLPEDRLAFLRLLLTDDIENSAQLCNHFIEQMIPQAKVRPVHPQEPLRYLQKACLPTQYEGVYARNLSLTRMVHGTLCYGEALCQDNLYEARFLNRADYPIGNIRSALRVRDVAEAYYQAIRAYAVPDQD